MRTVIIGLDGATWRVLDPLIDKGVTPVIRDISRGGFKAPLRSTIPPITGVAWPAMATGKNPGKLGMIDHLRRTEPGSFKLRPVSSADIRGQTIWDYLGYAGYRVGVFNYPLLFPPYPVNGFMVSGLGADTSLNFTYPESLKGELDEASGGYYIYVTHYDKKYWDNPDLLLEDLFKFMDMFERATLYVVENKEWDFLFTVLSATDWIQHAFWMYIDDTHPFYDPRVASRYKKGFEDFWARVDEYIGKIIDRIGDDAIVFLVSDHGFGPARSAFNLWRWLIMKGYMKVKKEKLSRLLLKKAYPIARRILPGKVKAKLRSKARSAISYATLIDYEESTAVCLGHSIEFGAIYLTGKDREETLGRITKDLLNIPGEIGVKKVDVYFRDKTWWGEKLALLPDILVIIDEGACNVVETKPEIPLFLDEPLSPRLSGCHRRDGIFAVYGPGIRRGAGSGPLNIWDVAPTILHIYGLPIPSDIDGRVVREIFREDSVWARREVRRVNPARYRAALKMRALRRRVKKP